MVVVSSLSTGGTTYRDPGRLTLPPGTRAIDIAYTALRLPDPRRVEFRYRLEGVNENWIDPGARRLASYDNLDPGHYRFEVMASASHGRWKRTRLDFDIQPTFLQSWPFKLFCLLLAGAMLWLAYSMRLRFVAGGIRQRMTERLDERERIARELHDTLLQGFQGLILRFQAATNQLSRQEPVRPLLDQALDRAEEVLIEGRNRVRGLRIGSGDLPQVLTDLANEMAATWPATFRFNIEGEARVLHPTVAMEICSIAEEGVRNAFQHAQARVIEATLIYHATELRFRLLDDGVGLPGDVKANGEREGHYGLVGMRERATRIRASLVIDASASGGTEILLCVPASAAYVTAHAARWRLPFLRNANASWKTKSTNVT
jgi:signal transduction histidine kinase